MVVSHLEKKVLGMYEYASYVLQSWKRLHAMALCTYTDTILRTAPPIIFFLSVEVHSAFKHCGGAKQMTCKTSFSNSGSTSDTRNLSVNATRRKDNIG